MIRPNRRRDWTHAIVLYVLTIAVCWFLAQPLSWLTGLPDGWFAWVLGLVGGCTIGPDMYRLLRGRPGPARNWLAQLLSGQPHQIIGANVDGSGQPYLRRWYLIPRNRFGNVYLHQFLRSDEDRALHNHPWWFVSMILRGAYDEITDSSTRRRSAGSIAFRPAKWSHRVQLLPRECSPCKGTGIGYGKVTGGWLETDCSACDGSGETGAEAPTWTLIVTGPRRHVWGFWCKAPNDVINNVTSELGLTDPADRFVPWEEWGAAGCGESNRNEIEGSVTRGKEPRKSTGVADD